MIRRNKVLAEYFNPHSGKLEANCKRQTELWSSSSLLSSCEAWGGSRSRSLIEAALSELEPTEAVAAIDAAKEGAGAFLRGLKHKKNIQILHTTNIDDKLNSNTWIRAAQACIQSNTGIKPHKMLPLQRKVDGITTETPDYHITYLFRVLKKNTILYVNL